VVSAIGRDDNAAAMRQGPEFDIRRTAAGAFVSLINLLTEVREAR